MLAEDSRLLSQRQRTLSLMAQQALKASGLRQFPLPTSPTRATWRHSSGCYNAQWVCITAEEWQAANKYTDLCPRGRLLYWIANKPALWFTFQDPWKDSPEQEQSECSQDIQKCKRSMEIGLPIGTYTLPLGGKMASFWNNICDGKYTCSHFWKILFATVTLGS